MKTPRRVICDRLIGTRYVAVHACGDGRRLDCVFLCRGLKGREGFGCCAFREVIELVTKRIVYLEQFGAYYFSVIGFQPDSFSKEPGEPAEVV